MMEALEMLCCWSDTASDLDEVQEVAAQGVKLDRQDEKKHTNDV